MPLTLSMRGGDDFYVDDTQVILREIHSSFQAVVVLNDGQSFKVFEDRAVEVLPGVYISMGHEDQSNMVRMVIDAPRDKLILTGRNYRKRDMSVRARHPGITDQVIEDAISIGMGDTIKDAREEILRMVKLSAPLSHRAGNRRYKYHGFFVEDGQVKGVFKISEEEVIGDVVCPDCNDDGLTCDTCGDKGWVAKELAESIVNRDLVKPI